MHSTTASTDADLASLIDKTKNETLSCAARMSAVHVGEALLNQTALLLLDVYDYFHENL